MNLIDRARLSAQSFSSRRVIRQGALLCIAVFSGGRLSAQWTAGAGGSIHYDGGYVGIGTTAPTQPLEVNGTIRSDGTFPLLIGTSGYAYIPANTSHIAYYRQHGPYEFYWRASTSGQPFGGTADQEMNLMSLDDSRFESYLPVGVGVETPRSQLDVNGYIVATNRLTLAQDTGTTTPTWHVDNSDGLFRLFWQPNINTGGTVVMAATTAGNVGIGTADPQNKLSVLGTIQATEVLVNTGWADYVFDPDYRLLPLSEVAAYIKQNHHLPDVPSEAEVKQKGVPVGEMESKLLAKVEELTLRMIQFEQRDKELRTKNQELQQRVLSLEERVRPPSGPDGRSTSESNDGDSE